MITDLFEINIIKNAFIVVTLVAPIASIFGVFLILKRYVFFADTLAHVGFLAMALSIFFDANPLFVLVLLSVIIALLVEQLRTKGKLPAEGSLSLFLYGGVALSVVFITLSGKGGSVVGILFGSLSTVAVEDIYLIAPVAFLCLIFLVKYHRKVLNICIDEELAHASGINVSQIRALFAASVALSISISIKSMGALLIGSLMVIPALTAVNLARSLRGMATISLIISILSSYLGIFLSYYSGIPLGASISVVLLGFFVISMLYRFLKAVFNR